MYEDTMFFSLNKKSDWQQGTAYNLHLTEEGLRMEHTVRYGWLRDISLQRIEGAENIVNVALGPGRTLLLLDHAANVWLYDYVNSIYESIFPHKHGLFTRRAMLVATEDLLVVAERVGDHGVSAYSLSNIQSVWELHEWEGEAICPIGIATNGQQDIYLLLPERTVHEGRRRIVPAGSALLVLKIGPGGRVQNVYRTDSLRMKQTMRLSELNQRFALHVQPSGQLYLLDTLERQVYVYQANGQLERQVAIAFAGRPTGIGVDLRGTMYVSDGSERSEEGPDARFVQSYHPDGSWLEALAGTQGRTDKLLTGHQNLLYLWNRQEARLSILEQMTRVQGAGASGGAPEGVYFSRAFDAVVSETIWHKLLVEAELPDETQLRVSYVASDHPLVWLEEGNVLLDEFLHDTSRTLEEKLHRTRHLWQGPILNPRDALLRAQGRYLWLKIEWSGSDKKTPLLKKLRVYYPRITYLQYLPAVYQQDPQSRDFLERFLSLFGTFFDEMEEAIDHIAHCFDADGATGDLLKWLSTWLGIAVDDRWTEEQTRQLLKRAPELYQKRGTREGLQELIEIFTGEKPFLVEFFQYKYLIEKADIRRTMEELYGLDPYRFCVLVKPGAVPDERRRALLQKLLDEECPAFAEAQLIVLEPWIHMGSHAYLGINSFLQEPSLLVLDDKAQLPYNTVLVDVDRDSRIGLHTRLGMDSTLE